jgi:hypothetical protein
MKHLLRKRKVWRVRAQVKRPFLFRLSVAQLAEEL